jgi:hypothetical protein
MRAAHDRRPPDTFDALRAQLAALTARVAVLEAERVPRGPQHRLRRADRARLVKLLPAIIGALGSEAFFVADLFDEPAVCLVLEALRPAQVGQLFERANGVPVEGFVVLWSGRKLQRVEWRVLAAL